MRLVTDVFFAFNHQNYSRWLVRYNDNLLKLNTTHPEVYQEFQQGNFAVRRTKKPFSGSSIDLTLEQTINANAASQTLGISHMTNSISARQRWALSHADWMTVITNVLQDLSITKKEDVTAELRKNRMTKDRLDLCNLRYNLRETMNPFDPTLDPDFLFNIASGKSASEDTAGFLLNCRKIGKKRHDQFITECIDKPSRFEEKITRQEVVTFEAASKKQKISSKDNSILSFKMMRDVFGSILHWALEKKIDMGSVLQYPLTKFPLSLSHCDGSMQKTSKSKLLQHLESIVEPSTSVDINVTIIDAFFFLHLSTNLPKYFGGVAEFILRNICNAKGTVIHFISDKTVSPSIKDAERDSRSKDAYRSTSFAIGGPKQERPSDWLRALRCDAFKKELIQFLVDNWAEGNYAYILKEKILYANCGNVCYSFKAVDNKVIRSIEHLLYSTHEEADSRIIFHLGACDTRSEVVIRTNDTDVGVILLGCYEDVSPELVVWLEMGVYSNNTQRYINVTKLYQKLGKTLSKALLGFHALTGSDYSASFSRRGKVAPFKNWKKNESCQTALGNLGNSEYISEEVTAQIEKFVCQMYGYPKFSSIDEVRLEIFVAKYRSKKREKSLFAKNLHSNIFPPCKRVLQEKIKRTNFIAAKWKSLSKSSMSSLNPVNCGWTIEEGKYVINWYSGPEAPSLLDVTAAEVVDEDERCTSDDDDCSDNSVSDTDDD